MNRHEHKKQIMKNV